MSFYAESVGGSDQGERTILCKTTAAASIEIEGELGGELKAIGLYSFSVLEAIMCIADQELERGGLRQLCTDTHACLLSSMQQKWGISFSSKSTRGLP